MEDFGTFTNVSQYLPPAAPLRVNINRGWEYVRIINNSPYLLSVDFGSSLKLTLPEMYLEDIRVPGQNSGWLTITPTANLSNTSQAISNTISVNTFSKGELASPQAQPLTQQAVNVTASGKPIFTAQFGFASTATVQQGINVFNPATSGVIATFHSAKAFTTDTSSNVLLVTKSGADKNLANAVSAVSHSGQATPPVSVMHVTADDSLFDESGSIIEALNLAQNTEDGNDILQFPDNATLYPGNNMLLVIGGATGKRVHLTIKWTETVFTFTPVGGVGLGTIANQVINDGNPFQQVLEATKSGDTPSDVVINNDGTMTLKGSLALNVLNDLNARGILSVTDTGPGTQNTRLQADTLIRLQVPQGTDAVDISSTLLTVAAAITAVFNGQMQPNQAGAVTAGSVSGTATFYAPVWGTGLKIGILILSNYDNASAATFNFPSSITTFIAYSGPLGAATYQMLLSGVAVGMFQWITLGAAGAAGTFGASQTTARAGNLVAGSGNAVNQLTLSAVGAATFASIVFIGV